MNTNHSYLEKTLEAIMQPHPANTTHRYFFNFIHFIKQLISSLSSFEHYSISLLLYLMTLFFKLSILTHIILLSYSIIVDTFDSLFFIFYFLWFSNMTSWLIHPSIFLSMFANFIFWATLNYFFSLFYPKIYKIDSS
jgi:hypothetical protein